MDDTERYKLLHGPYVAPACERGGVLFCEYRDEEVKVGGLTNAPIQWPRVLKTGKSSLIVCGDLALAIRTESEQSIAHHWGVGIVTVWKWRVALGVPPVNGGTARLHRDYQPEKFTREAYEKMAVTARTPEARERQASLKRGKPIHPNTRKVLLRYARRKKSESHRKAMSWSHVLRCHGRSFLPVDTADRPWTDRERALLGQTLDRTVAKMIGRTVHAVRSQRRLLDIPESNHAKRFRIPKRTNP